MAKVHVISTYTIKQASPPLNNNSIVRIELTPWDLKLLLVDTIQKGLLFLKPTSQQEKAFPFGDNLIDHLKASLSRTLDFFPPLAGRLAITKNPDNTTSFFVNCNNAGVHFLHATANDVAVADIVDPAYVPPVVRFFFPMNGVRNHESITEPFLAVQVTELVDGYFIACSMNHTLGDGSCFWQFFNSWSEISRGFNHISRPPFFDRWFLHQTDCPIRLPLREEDLRLSTGDPSVSPELQERFFHFSRENIAKLKAKANAEMGTDRISSLQAVLAHVWRSVVRCQRLDPSRETNLMLAIGTRQRLRPPLPEGYFGNAIYCVVETTTAGELLSHGFGWAAKRMNETVASQTDEEVRKYYENWVRNPNIAKRAAFTGDFILTSSSPRFNVYGTDFGWGKPVAVRSGLGNKGDGKITVYPGVEQGSIDIEACLLSKTLHDLENSTEFMEAIAVSHSL